MVKEGPVSDDNGEPYNYIIVIDMGSSGSRLHIYHYPRVAKDQALPTVDKGGHEWAKKVQPGISSFAGEDKIGKIGKDHLKKLLKYASGVIPKSQHSRTPIFAHGTGGLRLVSVEDQSRILAEVCNYIQKNSNFWLSDCSSHVDIISGEVEGIFGWLALNYMIGGIGPHSKEHDHGKGHSTYGFLEMGGASSQITFVPNTTEIDSHKNNLYTVDLGRPVEDGPQTSFQVYSKTFLGAGVNSARENFIKSLESEDGIVKDPCSLRGYEEKLDVKRKKRRDKDEEKDEDEYEDEYEDKYEEDDTDEDDSDDDDEDEEKHQNPKTKPSKLIGTGDFEQCKQLLHPFYEEIGSPDTPSFDFEINHFVGVSEYWDATEGAFRVGGQYKYQVIENEIKEFCQTDWKDVSKKFENIKKKDLETLCFRGSWVLGVAHEGFKFPIESTELETKSLDSHNATFLQPLQSVGDINGEKFSWTLGRALLYAASETESDADFAVGISSGDVSGESPSSKLYGGELDGSIRPALGQHGKSEDYWQGFDSHSHRLWGSIGFLAILVVAVYLLMGRARRAVIYDSIKTRMWNGKTYNRLDVGDDLELGAVGHEDSALGHVESEFIIDDEHD